MRRHCSVPAVIAAISFASWGAAADLQFADGIRIKSDAKPIDINVGHLVPCVTDWNGDGRKDLVVGQFDGGRIRLYLNQGTDSEPVFKDFSYLFAGGKEILLSAA